MKKTFFDDLKKYYANVGKVLKGQADEASIFPNTTDIGGSREAIYQRFLIRHAPSKCNIKLGGFLFGKDGNESKQLDILIFNDNVPNFRISDDQNTKSFGPVDGCIGAVSVKSTLNKAELYDSLLGFAAIPDSQPLKHTTWNFGHYDQNNIDFHLR